MLRAEGLVARAGNTALTFDVEKGRCVGLLGSDLDALCRISECVSGIRVPAAGHVRITALDSNAQLDVHRDADRVRRQIAVRLPETAHRLTTLGEHLAAVAGARPARVTAASAMARLGLDPKMPLATSSARSAAALAAALLPDAPLVILHDPFQSLDAGVRAKGIDWIRSLASSGTSVLVTGTEERDVRAVSHAVIEIGAGR